MTTDLVRKLAEVVARRSILADNEEALGHAVRVARATVLPSTTNGVGVFPDNLREVTSGTAEARVVPVVVNALMTPAVDEGVPAIEASTTSKALSVSGLSGVLGE